MEEPGFVTNAGRIRLAVLILSSCILFAVIITPVNFKAEKKMEKHGSIKGILKNKAGIPVGDAIIMIKESNHEFNDIASVSNSDGEFFVSDIVIPGRYVLQVQHDTGSFTKEINVTSADTVLSISF
jgi:hypothetical protein